MKEPFIYEFINNLKKDEDDTYHTDSIENTEPDDWDIEK